MAEGKRKSIFCIMNEPRVFMRVLAPSLKHNVWLVAWLFGTVLLFTKSFAFALGVKYSLSMILLCSVVFGIPAGFIFIYVYSFLLFITGKIFRGKATFNQVRDAYAWTRLFDIFTLVSWLGLISLFGRYAFTPLFLNEQAMGIAIFGLIGIQVVATVWETIVLFHTLGEVQGLSAWIMIWNVLFASILFMILDGSLNWVLSSTTVIGSFTEIGSLLTK